MQFLYTMHPRTKLRILVGYEQIISNYLPKMIPEKLIVKFPKNIVLLAMKNLNKLV